ncbi:UvrD-helicase domain-containing protein [Thermomonas sp.]|uniref:UvrD-helicase domain-containing protein n=1 Tax=Thermomonas sp. TaxID=1971895 RepID=UPI0024872C40|nr:UvrD-helicase domain-containing protein [Thermomonas sp.]MDI1252299.1 UvrD-helicase domain-containing protein [Thermomonas sp.]
MTTSDWRALSLAPGGRSLVEASAGTGKTWTIAALYLRLLLEPREGGPISPRGIVVSTFTDAAAQELRQRIRARLQGAQELLARARHAPDELLNRDLQDDEVLHWLRGCCLAADGSVDAGKLDAFHLRLQLALAELDQAPIGTLHALCQRILREQPFASGMGFGQVELVAGRELDGELADDLWRQLAQSPEPLSPEQQVWFDVGRAQLTRALGDALKPGVEVPCPSAPDIASLLQPDMAIALREYANDAGWFKSARSVWIRGLHGLADWIDAGDPGAGPEEKVLDDLGKRLETQIKPARLAEAETDDVFAFVMRATDLLSTAPAILRARGLAEFVPQLRDLRDARLQARGQLSFDAVIVRVHAALQGSPALADALHSQWPVALVDEFQDTDGLQYQILDLIYRDAAGIARERQVRGRLVMIGDPKQAIYRFRGGDIDAYLRAASKVDVEDVMHLDTNHRSARGYVDACNELFDIAGHALSADVQHTIAYRDVLASARRDGRPYRVDGSPVVRPLVFHYLEEVPANADERRDAALDACADHIVQLLSGSHAIGDALLQPGDIAVLLPKNRQISELRMRLRARGVPCVGGGRSSVFATNWARELQLLLHAAAQPADPGLVRGALATRIGGLDYQTLRSLADAGHDVQWQQCLDRFIALHALWESCGVLAVVKEIIDIAAPRLTAAQDGERALTDLRHIGELLQAQEARQPGHAQLLAWLSAQRDGDGSDSEDAANGRELRIESDAKRVQLMTLHAAKGLEFPVVLLPLMWDSTWHKPTNHHGFVIVTDPVTGIRQLRNDAAACEQARWEDQEERFRLLYVALTRAEHACHVYALPTDRQAKGNSKSSLQDPERSPLDALLVRAEAALEEQHSLQDASEHIAWQLGWPETSGRYQMDVAPRKPVQVRPEPPPAQLVRRHSFSSMLRGSHGLQQEHAATDEAPTLIEDFIEEGIEEGIEEECVAEEVVSAYPELAALAHWRGIEFGLALHDVLEQRRIGLPIRKQPKLVRDCLRMRGVRPWQEGPELEQMLDIVVQRLDATLDTELQPGLRLSDLPAHALRAEMAFDYLLGDASTDRLRSVCRAAGEESLMPVLAMHTLRGLMNGKIDLVFEHAGRFHVLDWKGNWLGDQLDNYAPIALPAAMDVHHYRLQALLYTVALHRYLRMRLGEAYRPTEHLGDPVYLFLRAVGLTPGAGVWTQHFSPALIEAVDAALAGKPEVCA